MLFGKYINKYYKKYGFFFIVGILFLILVDYLQLYIPEFLGTIIDFFNNGTAEDHWSEVIEIIFKVLAVAFGMFAGRIVWRFTIFHASTGIAANLREEMFLKAERLSTRYYHETKAGNIISWFTTDIETIEDYYGWGTITLIDAIFLSIFAIVKMFMLDTLMTLITLIPALLIIVWGFFVEKQMSLKRDYLQKETDRLYDFTQENFTGIRVIKAFVKENQQLLAFGKVAKRNKDVNIEFTRFSVVFDILISVILAVVNVIILGIGSWLVYNNYNGTPVELFGGAINLTAGKLVTFYGYYDTLVWPLIALGQIFTMKSRAKTSLKRVSNFLDEEEEIKNPENPIVLDRIEGNIEFRNFSFHYPNSNFDALKNISFKINKGEKIGIVGKIGSGKTTLVNALFRLYNIEKGTLFIDDKDIMECDIASVRNNLAYVPQDNFLFSDTIKHNIAFSNEESTFESVVEAAKFADVADNINEFKEKYETVSGERGVTLSGGQKQRISIARAYLKKSPVLVMDDSVSAVDVKTEETILKHINEDRKGLTTIIVASRISTVQHLDKILVLNEGELEGFDSHKNLVKTSKTYQRMVYLQELEKEVEGGKNG